MQEKEQIEVTHTIEDDRDDKTIVFRHNDFNVFIEIPTIGNDVFIMVKHNNSEPISTTFELKQNELILSIDPGDSRFCTQKRSFEEWLKLDKNGI